MVLTSPYPPVPIFNGLFHEKVLAAVERHSKAQPHNIALVSFSLIIVEKILKVLFKYFKIFFVNIFYNSKFLIQIKWGFRYIWLTKIIFTIGQYFFQCHAENPVERVTFGQLRSLTTAVASFLSKQWVSKSIVGRKQSLFKRNNIFAFSPCPLMKWFPFTRSVIDELPDQ